MLALIAYDADVAVAEYEDDTAVCELVAVPALLANDAVVACCAYDALNDAETVSPKNTTELTKLALKSLNIAGVIWPELLLGKSCVF